MWLYVPGMESSYVPEPECSAKASGSAASSSESSCGIWLTLSGTLTRRPLSWRGWLNRPWIKLLSGTISQPSMANRLAERWTSSVLASRVSHTPAPASSGDTPTSGATGTETAPSRTSSESWPSVVPPWCSSKTSLPGFAAAGFDLSERNYADWVTRSKTRSFSLRKRLARATSASWFSCWPTVRSHEVGNYQNQKDGTTQPTLTGSVVLWPTPAANDDNKTPEAHLAMKKRMGERDGTGANRTAITSLNVLTQLWPSPRSEDSESCGNHPEAMDSGSVSRGGERIDEPLLAGQVKAWPLPMESAWPTPSARDYKGANHELPTHNARPLNEVAKVWATPNATAATRGGVSQKNKERDWPPKELTDEAKLWPTPNATDSESAGGPMQSSLTNATSGRYLLPAPTLPGHASPKPSGRRLNPAFVCWLMGSPWFWTRAEPINSGAQATASWRSAAQSLLSSLCGEP